MKTKLISPLALMEPSTLYQLLHLGNPGDAEFYGRVCTGAARVLELGCGWGRISNALSKAGHEVVGIDNNVDFLTRARRESQGKVLYHLADATELETPLLQRYRGYFDRVLLPYNTLYALGGEDRIASCLTAARNCLTPDGEIWFDIYPMDDLHEALCAGESIDEDTSDPILCIEHEGRKLNVFETTVFHPESQRLEVTYRAVDGAELRGCLDMTHYYLIKQQLLDLLTNQGLVPLAWLTSFPSPRESSDGREGPASSTSTDGPEPQEGDGPWIVGVGTLEEQESRVPSPLPSSMP